MEFRFNPIVLTAIVNDFCVRTRFLLHLQLETIVATRVRIVKLKKNCFFSRFKNYELHFVCSFSLRALGFCIASMETLIRWRFLFSFLCYSIAFMFSSFALFVSVYVML